MSIRSISPLDGRYADKVDALRGVFSEYALIKNRLKVEVLWLQTLCECPDIEEARALTKDEGTLLNDLIAGVDDREARRVKEIEHTTNHDVKAVEYYLNEVFADTSLKDLRAFIHFACTSEDINNLAHGLMLKEGLALLKTAQAGLLDQLEALAMECRDAAMLARTHGQPASPTTMGKELRVFVSRLQRQMTLLSRQDILGKMNGAVGNYNAHVVTYPAVDWPSLTKEFIERKLGLKQNPLTTQIENHDYMAELFDGLARWNTILMDLNRDCWSYISLGYFKQKVVAGEVGSSTMPHKVNPIDFENSEGNLGLANALLHHLSSKLPQSRLQRDLTDSTVLRNMGVALGYALLAYASSSKGLGKLQVDRNRMLSELSERWELMAEPIQMVMRKNNVDRPYERLKDLTRGQKVDRETITAFVEGLPIKEEDKRRLLALTPATYTGLAAALAGMGDTSTVGSMEHE